MTSPGAYSAGTAYLDVIPSFRGVQNAIRREVGKMERALGQEAGEQFGKSFETSATKAVDKALGTTKDSARKSGKEAAEAYSDHFTEQFERTIKSVQKQMAGLRFDVQPSGFDKIRREIEELSKKKIGTDINAGPAMIELGRLEAKLHDIQESASDIRFRSNLGKLVAEFEAFRKRIEKDAHFDVEVDIDAERSIGLFEKTVKRRIQAALANFPPIEFNADTTEAENDLMRLRQRLIEIGDKRIGIDIGGSEALREIEALRAELAGLAKGDTDVDVKVKVDAAGAAAELLALKALCEVVDKTDVEVEVKTDVDRALTGMARFIQQVHSMRDSLTGAGSDGRDAGNAFRAFNAIVLAVAFGVSALAPLLASAAGAIALFGAAAIGAAAGLGVMFIGFSGITKAVQALGKAQQNQASDSVAQAKAIRTASASVSDAERSVESARTNAARSARDSSRQIEDAIGRQRDAEEALVDAQRDVVRAQEEVNDAREAASDRIEELAFRLQGGALAERQAVLDLKEARQEYEDALKDPKKTADEREELLISYEREKLQLAQIRDDNADMAREQAENRRKGIEGSDEVVAAQDRVRDAQGRVGDAADRVRDAEQAVSDARRDAAERAADANQAILAAQENLMQANERLEEANNKVSESAQNAMEEMAKLGPAGQRFAEFIHGLRGEFRTLRDVVQAGMLPGVETAIDTILTKNGPLLKDFLATMGKSIGDLFIKFGEVMTSPQWQSIWKTVTEFAPTFFTQFFEIGLNLLTGFGELFVAFAPSAERFGDALVRMSDNFATWAANLKNTQGFQDFLAWLFTNGPIIWDTVVDIGGAFINLIIALEPLGMLILGIVDGLAEMIAGMDPVLLGTIVTLILGLVVAFQLAAGAVAVVSGIAAVLTGTLSLIIFAVVAVVAALVALYTQSDTARAIIDGVFRAIGAVISWWWGNVVAPIWDLLMAGWDYIVEAFTTGGNTLGGIITAIGDFFSWLWRDILKPIFETWQVVWDVLWAFMVDTWNRVGKPIFETLWEIVVNVWEVIRPIFELIGLAFQAMFWLMAKAWEYVGKPIFDAVVAITKFLWKNVISPILGFIVDRWEFLWAAIELVWTSVGKPVFDFVQAVIETLVAVFTGNFDKLSKIWNSFWDSLKVAAAKPINFVIHFVLNKGLFGAFNWIIDKLGLNKDWKITPWKQVGPKAAQYAAGGKVAGWSPHDKADNIPAMLTAGEWVQPVQTVDYYGTDIMDAMRKKRIPREVLQYYATGGLVVPGYATGGQIYDFTRRVFPRAKLNSSYRPGDPGYHGQNMAADMGEAGFSGGAGRSYIALMKRWWVDNYGKSAEEIIYDGLYNSRPDVKNGRSYDYGAATRAQHHNHLHVAESGPLGGAIGGPGSFGGGGTFGSSGGTDWMAFLIGDLAAEGLRSAGDVFDKLKNSVNKIKDIGSAIANSPVASILKAMPGKAVSWMWDKISGPVKAFWAGITDNGDDALIAEGASGVQKVVQGLAAMPEYGWGGDAQWQALKSLIQGESSWNPRAQNPTSTASGLFQFINSTWQAYRPVGENASTAAGASLNSQARAGLNYIKDVYGSPLNAYRQWSARAPHWYSEGGLVSPGVSKGDAPGGDAAPTLYDTGGWLPPGIHTVLNASNRPEPILTAAQWDELTRARQTDAGGDSGGFRHLHLHEQAYDVSDAVAVLDHTVRVLRNTGGRYAGTRG